mgnify:CR=1 FL=1
MTRTNSPAAGPQYAGRLGDDPGLSRATVLRSITMNSSYALHQERETGSLEVGKLADMVVMDANPLDNIRNTTSISYTIANGRVYDSGMNEVAPRQRARAPFWFAQAGGEHASCGTCTDHDVIELLRHAAACGGSPVVAPPGHPVRG